MVKTWEKRVGDPSILHMNEFTDDLKTKYPIYLLVTQFKGMCRICAMDHQKGFQSKRKMGKMVQKTVLTAK